MDLPKKLLENSLGNLPRKLIKRIRGRRMYGRINNRHPHQAKAVELVYIHQKQLMTFS